MNLIIKKDSYSIFISIVFFVIGLFMFLYPNDIVKFITYIVGVLFVVFGSLKLYSHYKLKESIGNFELTLGISCVIIGIIIMFCNDIIEVVIRFAMGGYILANGMNKVIVSFNSRSYNNKWIGLLIVGLLLIIGGLYIILKSNLIISTIGLCIIIFSSIDIISFLLYPKNKDVV